MEVIHTIAGFRAWRKGLGLGIAGGLTPFVPTMGALHAGHASLVRRAREMVDSAGTGEKGAVMASIFVNPTQFGPSEDFAKYPRTLEADVRLLEGAGCEGVFVPAAAEMYGGEMNTVTQVKGVTVDPGALGEVLEGAIRPGHFRGVCTVVAKLLNVTGASHLLLGQKDFQQQAVLRRMCRGLDMAVEVVTCETMREADGLAMSSRNRYLNGEERGRAVGLYEALKWGAGAFGAGERRAAVLEAGMKGKLQARGLEVQYAVVVEAGSLEGFGEGEVRGEAVMLIAAKLGGTRLIDNMRL